MLKLYKMFALIGVGLSLLSNVAISQERVLKFAVIPQGAGNQFFLDVKHGCESAAADLGGIECHYGGPPGADVRAQSQYINRLIEQGIDGIAVSVIDSTFLAEHTVPKAQAKKIPLISFNSDFNRQSKAAYEPLRSSYVGTDNFQFGWVLGELTQQLRPNGGSLCLISGHKSSPALQSRLNGVRAVLAGISKPTEMMPPLKGENGWTEYSRCPFYSNDLPHRALAQLSNVLRKNEKDPSAIDTIVAVGAWPQQNEEAYRKALMPYKNALATKKVVIVMGDAMAQQVRLLNEDLAHGNIGQNPYQMGYEAIKLLNRLRQGEKVPDTVYTPMVECLPDRSPTCSGQ